MNRPLAADDYAAIKAGLTRLHGDAKSAEVVCPVCDSCADLGWCAKHNDALKEIERLRSQRNHWNACYEEAGLDLDEAEEDLKMAYARVDSLTADVERLLLSLRARFANILDANKDDEGAIDGVGIVADFGIQEIDAALAGRPVAPKGQK